MEMFNLRSRKHFNLIIQCPTTLNGVYLLSFLYWIELGVAVAAVATVALMDHEHMYIGLFSNGSGYLECFARIVSFLRLNDCNHYLYY